MEQTQDRNISVRMPEGMASVIDDLARDDQRTFSHMVRILLEKAIAEYTENGK